MAPFPLMIPQARFACVHVADKGANRRETITSAMSAIKAAGDPAGAFLVRPLDATRNEVLTGRDLARELDRPRLEVVA